MSTFEGWVRAALREVKGGGVNLDPFRVAAKRAAKADVAVALGETPVAIAALGEAVAALGRSGEAPAAAVRDRLAVEARRLGVGLPITEGERAKYRAGAYRCPAPSVPTAGWDDDAWIRWIRAAGTWLAR